MACSAPHPPLISTCCALKGTFTTRLFEYPTRIVLFRPTNIRSFHTNDEGMAFAKPFQRFNVKNLGFKLPWFKLKKIIIYLLQQHHNTSFNIISWWFYRESIMECCVSQHRLLLPFGRTNTGGLQNKFV